jgi:hypothetical protein
VSQQTIASNPMVCPHTEATLSTLRVFGMRRNSSRRNGRGIPVAVSRSVGNTSGRAEGGGTIEVGRTAGPT